MPPDDSGEILRFTGVLLGFDVLLALAESISKVGS